MIISHEHQLIFLKTAKTAGTSIEIALSRFCGSLDVITPLSSKDEEIRRQLGYRGPQHYLARLATYSPRDVAALLLKGKLKRQFYNHMPAAEIKPLVGNTIWNRYYKFCVERNPWDKAISYYYHRHKTEPRPNFSKFLKSGALSRLQRAGRDVYCIGGDLAVDEVCDYDNLNEDLERVRVHLGLPQRIELPNAKRGFRKDGRPSHQILSSEDAGQIAVVFSGEIQRFGFVFGKS